MSFANTYFTKISNHTSIFREEIHNNYGICVVIPCYDEPNIIATIKSLYNCTAPPCIVKVFVIINASAKANDGVMQQNENTYSELLDAKKALTEEWFSLHIYMDNNLPKKHAGAGLARKIGMDEACMQFNALNKPGGIIVSLDADTLVDENYFTAIYNEMQDSEVGIIPFTHKKAENKNLQYAVDSYELHLRYVKNAFHYIGYPFSFHTIGSAFCVKAETYARFGGMNKKHAGEDFYFLHKLFPHCKVKNISGTEVYPDSRLSERVPFGTGPALKKIIADQKMETYNFSAFQRIKEFIDRIDLFFDNQCNIQNEFSDIWSFLCQISFPTELQRIQNNCASLPAFRKNFFLWFNAFAIVKLINWLHLELYEKQPIEQETLLLLSALDKLCDKKDTQDLLKILKSIDESGHA